MSSLARWQRVLLVEVMMSPLEEAMASLLGVSLASEESSESVLVIGRQLRASPLVVGREPDVSLELAVVTA